MNDRKIAILLISFFTFLSVSCGSTVLHPGEQKIPRKSFTHIKKTYIINLCSSVKGKEYCAFTSDYSHYLGPRVAQGSGVIVDQTTSKIENTDKTSKHSIVLTAAHVCESKNSFPKDFKQRLEKQYPQMKDLKFPQPIGDYTNIQKIKIQSFIFVADLKGKLYFSKIIKLDPVADLCLLKTRKRIPYPKVKLAQNPPEIGEKVYNTAAPLGIFKPDMVPIFEGYYAGLCSKKTYFCPRRSEQSFVFSGLTVAPGSSGSPVYKKINGKYFLVSLIHSVHVRLPEISYGSTYNEVKTFLDGPLDIIHYEEEEESEFVSLEAELPADKERLNSILLNL